MKKFTEDDAKKIAEELKIDFKDFSLEEFLMGINHELEHKDITDGDPVETAKIALVHLKEDPKYYEKLEKMENSIHNAKALPQIFYATHIREGVSYYPSQKQKMLLIKDGALKKMTPTFVSKPVFVIHKDVLLPDIENESDGYIIESFFNPLDGCYWVKGLAITDKAQKAILDGWSVSNCYNITETGQGGTYNNVTYDTEVLNGVYDHLALVPNPQYEWAKIYTPEKFKEYQDQKKLELENIQNSKTNSIKKGDKKMFGKLFKKVPIENSVDIDEAIVEIPGKGDVPLADLIQNYKNSKKNSDDEKPKAKEDDEVEIDGDMVKVKDLVNCYKKNRKNAEDEEAEKKEAEAKKKLEEAEAEENRKNAEEEAKKKEEEEKNKKNAEEEAKKAEEEKKAENSKKYFEKLKNARESAGQVRNSNTQTVDLVSNQLKRGQMRYGSK